MFILLLKKKQLTNSPFSYNTLFYVWVLSLEELTVYTFSFTPCKIIFFQSCFYIKFWHFFADKKKKKSLISKIWIMGDAKIKLSKSHCIAPLTVKFSLQIKYLHIVLQYICSACIDNINSSKTILFKLLHFPLSTLYMLFS